MFQEIDAQVKKSIPLSDEDKAYFHTLLQYRKVRRKSFLLQEGEICGFTAYILKGCVRSYFVNEDAEEINIAFGVEDWWCGDPASFYEKLPTKMNIQALEDTELLVINAADIEKLFENIPAFERFFRILIHRNLWVLQQRLFSVIATPASHRYEAFTQKYPLLLQRIPLKHIASFLGISPEFLSKIRART